MQRVVYTARFWPVAVAAVLSLFLLPAGCQKSKQTNDSETETENVGKEDQTTKDLLYALAGEGEANRKYLAFAEIAEQQGYPQVARLWRAAAAAEAIHAKNHMRALGMLNSTQENLKSAVEGEQNEFTTMYPRFIKTAEQAGRKDAAQSMEWAFKVEQLHHAMFRADLEDLMHGKKPASQVYWVCSVCGNTVAGTPPKQCNICGTKNKFFEVK